jgi:hypothetical protein
VIGREDGDTYIAVFCDLQICGPLEKRRRHLCYFGNETNLEILTLMVGTISCTTPSNAVLIPVPCRQSTLNALPEC